MTSEDDYLGDDGRRAETTRLGRPRRRSRTVAGVAGLAVVLGAGAYMTTSAFVSDETPAAHDYRLSTPAVSDPPPSEADAPGEQTSALPSATIPATKDKDLEGGALAQAAQPEAADETRKRDTAAREAIKKDSSPLKRPLEPAKAGSVAITETTRKLDGEATMRIFTALGDLTGQRPLDWAADKGTSTGNSRCTQKFRFSRDEPGRVRPTMLLCWRTSATRSAAVLSVTPNGTPSTEETTATLADEWKKLN